MELSREAEDALFALFAVKEDFVSENAIEKALSKQAKDPEGQPKSLQRHLVEAGSLTMDQAKLVRENIDPEVIAGYRIEGEAGRGGMGVVYKARQLSMDRLVAVKVLSRRLSEDETFVAKFLTEAKSAAKLNHENIVAAINAGEANGLNYFVMEFVDGESVADQLDRGVTFDHQRAFEIAEQVARGLAHAHGAGLVHRDVKPENVMITSDGRAKLCDLGLAKPAQEAGTGEKSSMTEGTPYYCSPEQALGRTDIDPRSDIYSLGLTIYHMVVGDPPYDGESARAIMVKQVRSPFPSLDEKMPDVPKPLRKLLETMVVKDREDRLGSVRAFEEKLLAARKEIARGQRVPLATAAALRSGNAGTLIGVVAVFLVFAAVGAGLSLALVGDDPQTASGTGAETTAVNPTTGGSSGGGTGAATGGGETSGGETSGGGTGGGGTSGGGTSGGGTGAVIDDGDPELAAARKLFQEARDYQDSKPDDPWGAHQRYAKVSELYPTSPIAREAEAEMQALSENLGRAGSRGLEELAMQVLGLLEQGQYRQAREEVDAFETAWKPRKVPKLAGRVKRLRDSIDQQAGTKLQEVLGRADGGDAAALEELAALADRLPEGKLAERARQRLGDAAQREAQTAYERLMAQVQQALGTGDAGRAKRLLEQGKEDPTLKPLRPRIEKALADLSAQTGADQAFARSIEALTSKGQVNVRLVSGEQLEGRWTSTDARAWVGVFESGGASRTLDLSDLAADELLPMGLPEAQGRANALVLLGRGAPHAASAALAAWSRATGKQDAELAARVAAEESKAAEVRAGALITRLADPKLAPAEAVAGIKNFPAGLRSTAAYRNRFDLLKLAYQRARGAQIAQDEAKLFAGSYEKDRKGRVILTYDFSSAEQAKDFVVDKTVDDASRCEVSGGLVVRGKVLHVARFKGGELKLDLRATPRNAGDANVNLLLSSEPGWYGQLAGAGFKYGAMKQIKIDASAKKKGGYVVDLPANVFMVLEGKKPRMRMRKVMAAEEKPALKARRTRFVVQRSSKGKLKVKIGSRTIYSLDPATRWDQEGAIGFSPFASEVVVEELEISGVLADGWAQERGTELAKAEADALPRPGR